MEKWKNFVVYGFFGFLTTAVNYICFLVLDVSGYNYIISTSIAWVVSVLFAFITNKLFVFKSYTADIRIAAKELSAFFLLRLSTYFLDVFLMIMMVGVLQMHVLLSKILINIIIIVSNYLFSSKLIFKPSHHTNMKAMEHK